MVLLFYEPSDVSRSFCSQLDFIQNVPAVVTALPSADQFNGLDYPNDLDTHHTHLDTDLHLDTDPHIDLDPHLDTDRDPNLPPHFDTGPQLDPDRDPNLPPHSGYRRSDPVCSVAANHSHCFPRGVASRSTRDAPVAAAAAAAAVPEARSLPVPSPSPSDTAQAFPLARRVPEP